MSLADVAEARRRAELARVRLTEDVTILKDRTSPAALVADAREQAVTVAKSRPAVVAGVVAALLAIAAIPTVRRAGLTIARLGWRNRKTIGLLMGARARVRRTAARKKDQTR